MTAMVRDCYDCLLGWTETILKYFRGDEFTVNKRKKILAVVVLCLTAISNIALASIPTEEMNLGRVALHKRVKGSDVRAMYGEPTKQSYGSMQYGDSVFISFEEGMLTGVDVTANNGWKTLSGIHVGMKGEDAISVYGTPDSIRTVDDKTLYIFLNDEPSRRCAMGILQDKEKIIQKISIKTSLMVDFKKWYGNWINHMLQ